MDDVVATSIQKKEAKPDLVDRYLETEKLIRDGITLKAIADNLRSYPVIVIFWLAIAYLWKAPPSPNLPSWIPEYASQGVAALWGTWLFLFSVLTAMQSGFLILAAAVDILKANELFDRTWIRNAAMIISTTLAIAFMFGAWLIAEGLLNVGRR